MKNTIYKIAAGFIILITFSSCNPDALDTSPYNKYTESNYWKSEEAVLAAVTGSYGILRWDGIYGNEATPLWEETATPNAYNYSNAKGFNSIASGLQKSTTGGVTSTRWARGYGGIGRCNTVLERINDVEMDEDLRTRLMGETYFLRALYYFLLETYYGNVPLILEAPKLEHQELPRTPRKEVVAQILSDLDQAASVLPDKYTGNDVGRATKGAALALKARVLLYEASPLFQENQDNMTNESTGDPEKWKLAADAAKAVMDMGVYELFPDYRALFLPENENNEEVIFDVQYIYPDGGNSFDLICRQYNTNAPLKGMVSAYNMEDGLSEEDSPLYNPESPYENRDPRFYATMTFPGDIYMGEEVTEDRFAITGFGMKKYSIYDTEKPPSDLADLKGGQSETNYIVLRYGDILLMYAEAMNEYSGPSQEIYNVLNQIRERAGMPMIEPGYNQDELREIIRHERRVELAGEGYYYNDIRRWKTAEELLNGPVYAFDGEELEVRQFNPDRDYWWPIQQSELDLNPNLQQNKGY